MPVLAGIVIFIQFCFAFHAVRTGRPYWWLFVIMSFPVMGCIIYYFVEVFPGSREHRSAHKAVRRIAKALEPDADLRRRAEELEICGSVDNKMALAEECMNHQMHAEALKLYESCLNGAFATDGALLFGTARAAVEAGAWDKAASALARLKAAAPTLRPNEVRLLEARLLEGQRKDDEALSAYRDLLPAFVGLEARYRYADLLARLGHQNSAIAMFEEVVQHARRFASTMDDEQRWAEAARSAIAGKGPRA